MYQGEFPTSVTTGLHAFRCCIVFHVGAVPLCIQLFHILPLLTMTGYDCTRVYLARHKITESKIPDLIFIVTAKLPSQKGLNNLYIHLCK